MPAMSEAKSSNASPDGGREVETHLAATLVDTVRADAGHAEPDDSPRIAEALLQDALKQRATDVHLDPESRGLRVRLRIDGVMRDAALLTPKDGYRLINQLKSLAGLDPVAQFAADEARFAFDDEDAQVDLRLAVIPCLDGQKLTLRVLDPRRVIYGIGDLGLSEPSLERLKHWLKSFGGMFAVVGPVGSGKTTTLYALLHGLKLETCSASTLEDPVEYSVDGINQIQIDPEHGLTFPAGIRALARHDPDVVLVGELHDAATARAAYGAAALGRTVLTTMHARDAAGTVTSLRYFGLDDRDIATTLSVVVAQRLVRRLCPHCRRETTPDEEQRRWFELAEVPLPEASWKPGQCDHCAHSGFLGRTGVFEVWRLEEEDYHRLLDGATEREMRQSLAAREHEHFLGDALDKARSGVTTLSEVQRLHLAGPALPPEGKGGHASVAD